MRVLALLCLLVVGLAAQEPGKTVIQIPTILTFRKELALSDQQVESIQKLVQEFQQQAIALHGKIQAAETHLNADLAAHAELPKVKQSLQACYDARFALEYANLAMGRKLEATLSAEQLKNWRILQARARSQTQAP